MPNILNIFFPKRCAGCGKFGSYLCSSCLKNIPQSELICPSCERLAIGGATHPLCKKKHGLDGLWSLGVYRDPLRSSIQKLKYKFVSELALSLVDLMIEYWARFSPQFLDEIKKDRGVGWVVIPVPLHQKRQNWRGFNQSALLGQLLSKRVNLGYQEALKRVRYTKPQVDLKSWERKKNIKDAFNIDPSVVSLPQDDKLRAKNATQLVNCLLVDDVWTTGSTLKECCYVLKKAGAKKVWAITLAR